MKVKARISLGGVHRTKECEVDTEDLGFTEAEWRGLDDQSKLDAIIEYWNGMGLPEISYTEIE